MASILSIRMQKCSHITGAVNVLGPFSNVMNMRDVCLQHHSPLDKVKQSATKADFTIHGQKRWKGGSYFQHCHWINFQDRKVTALRKLEWWKYLQELNVNIHFYSLSKVNEKAVHWTRTLVTMSQCTPPTFSSSVLPSLFNGQGCWVGGRTEKYKIQGNLCPIFFQGWT